MRVVKKIGSLLMAMFLLIGTSTMARADAPILSDEPDVFLLTSSMKIGSVLGTIHQIFPNDKAISFTLRPPKVGVDFRGYIKPEHKDATQFVTIDNTTGEVRLKAYPTSYPHSYYALIKGENADGFMDQVLIVVAKEHMPTRDHALDLFTQKTAVHGIPVLASGKVSDAKFNYAANILKALLAKDWAGSKKITNRLIAEKAMMTLFYDFEERNTSIDYYMFDFNSQDLQDEEIIPDYTRLGGPLDLRRDASVEEITHLIQSKGINAVYPKWLAKLNDLTAQAINKKFYKPWDGLPEDSFGDEYFAIGVAIYYGMHQNQVFIGRKPKDPSFRFSLNTDVLLTKDNLKKFDPGLYALVEEVFPKPQTFRKALGWE